MFPAKDDHSFKKLPALICVVCFLSSSSLSSAFTLNPLVGMHRIGDGSLLLCMQQQAKDDFRSSECTGMVKGGKTAATATTATHPTSTTTTRREAFIGFAAIVSSSLFVRPNSLVAQAKCTDIDSCREIGERKDDDNMKAHPIVTIGDGLLYRVLAPGVGNESVGPVGKVEIAFTISQANGSYMYSKGMGYNKVNFNGQLVDDVGSLDSLVVNMGGKDVPVGIQQAMIGMKRGEKRRINCPPALGFETSDWNPQPTTFRGRQQIIGYQSRLNGRGDTQPPFPAPTVWEVEVLRIR